MKLFYLTITVLLVLVCGCGRSPVGPLPPVTAQVETFDQHVQRLRTPGSVYFWLQQFSVYDLGGKDHSYNRHWGNWKQLGYPDQAYALAHELYKNYINGKVRGVCGQLASMYVVAGRTHGLKCGFILMYSAGSGHAQAYVVEHDGSVAIADNKMYYKNSYKNWDDFLRYVRRRVEISKEYNIKHNTNSHAFGLLDEFGRSVINMQGEFWDNPQNMF